ncbi:hypothetical protein ACHAW6_005870 [Cyclotella cf. meneghiniana]
MASAVLLNEVSPNNMNAECDVGDNDAVAVAATELSENAGEPSAAQREDATANDDDDDGETTYDDPPCIRRGNDDKPREDAAFAAAFSWNPLEEVDSALLSALCDARERKALLRLERVLVEFMREADASHVEVGGAYNSIVLGNGEGVDRAVVSPQTMQEIQFQQQRGLRQTSFQRLILHRLADRFRIIREVIPSSNDNFISTLNLIRLVKTEESAMPQHLLIDVDLSLLVDYRNPLARESRASPNAVPFNNTHDENVKLLSDSMGYSTLQENAAPAQTSGKKSKKKMVIMKRNSAGGSGAEDKAKTKREGKSRLKGKKLVDKEKAYEEARARIFGVSETTAAADGSNCPDDGGCEKTPQLNPQCPEFAPQNNNNLGDSNHSVPAAAGETSGSTDETGKSPEQNEEETSTVIISSDAPKDAVSSETPANNSKQGSTAASSSSSSTPSAATATTKAVYRNRQQEENDPDFKRRSDIRPAYMPMPMLNGVPPYLSANPYAPNNPYVTMVNMAMGQPHPLSVLPGQPHPHLAYYGHLHAQTPDPQAYNAMYPNHTGAAPPQSPAFFVANNPQGKSGHPPDAFPSKKSSRSSKQTHREASSSTPPNDEGAFEPTREDGPRVAACSDGPRGDAVPTFYAAEDFPALR